MTDRFDGDTINPHQADWAARGACRDQGVDTFFGPDNERGSARRSREARAKSICRTCPVMRSCLVWATSTGERFGVWGGATPEERELFLRSIPTAA